MLRFRDEDDEDLPNAWPPTSRRKINGPAPEEAPSGLFVIPHGPRSAWDVIFWWERRRFSYNAFVFVTGACSLALFFFFITHSGVLKDGDDAVEPMALFAAPILINIAYTGGWIVELILRVVAPHTARRAGPQLLKAGFIFSAFVIALPTVVWGLAWLAHLFTRR